MRNRGDIFDHADFETRALQRTDCSLTACARSLHINLNRLHAVLHRCFCCGFRCGLCGKGVDFLEPLKPSSPELAQEIALPWVSVMVTIVLLKVDWI